jgi:FkbH-like protein
MLERLEWLLPPPDDFRQRVRSLRAAIAEGRFDGVVGELVALANHGLDLTQLEQLAKTARMYAEAVPRPELRVIRLGLLGTGTQDIIGGVLVGSALRHNLLLDIVQADYGAAVQAACDPGSDFRAQDPEFVLVSSDFRALDLDRSMVSAEEAHSKVEFAAGTLRAMVDGLKGWVRGGILFQTIVPPMEPFFGSLDLMQAQSGYAMVDSLNRRIAEWARAGDVTVVDVARAAAWVGLENWDDPARWHMAKMPFALDLAPFYGDLVARVLAAIAGKARKCLVLDLDNTLWGGVIGDDGVEGIVLGQGSAGGEAFLEIQRLARRLRQRGVILAVCSKNEQEAALLPFREHPEMELREDDIAVFHANWTDKASNLRLIAESLEIGLDALVFLDDNPAERAQVRRELPMVAVPELPEDPALYPRTLMAAGWFEAVSFVEEDARRADDYQAQVKRRELASSSDVAGYLASLEMTCSLKPFDAVGRARISQLVNKSNQFNLTTQRYTEAQIAAFEADPSYFTLQVRLADRFGDSGMISVIIFRKDGADWVNDTWLMSCRVLGRRVEEAVLAEVAQAARAEGAKRLVGRYLPSPKNKMVARHYNKLGFALAEETAEGATTWVLDLAAYQPPELPMQLERG